MRTFKKLGIAIKFAAMFLGTWSIYWLFLKITGHSPSIDEIILGMVSFNTVCIVSTIKVLSELNGRFREHAKNSDRRFYALTEDFKAYSSKKASNWK